MVAIVAIMAILKTHTHTYTHPHTKPKCHLVIAIVAILAFLKNRIVHGYSNCAIMTILEMI